jgi:hypothetical protein
MNTRVKTVLMKFCISAFFLALLVKVSEAPVGHAVPPESWVGAPLFITACAFVVLSGKWKRMHVHLVWGCFCLTVFLSIFRLYHYHKTNDELGRDSDRVRSRLNVEKSKP